MTKRKRMSFVMLSLFFMTQSSLKAQELVNVAVMNIKGEEGVSESMARMVSDLLRAELYETGRFEVMNREDMNSILKEMAFQQSGACDSTTCVVEMGQALGVKKMISGSIGVIEGSYMITSKLINVAEFKNEVMTSAMFEKGAGGDIRSVLSVMARRLAGLEGARPMSQGPGIGVSGAQSAFEGIQNTIIEIWDPKRRLCIVDAGKTTGVKNGDRYEVVAYGPDVVDPGTKAKTRGERVVLGVIRVIQVGNSTAVASYKKNLSEIIEIGQIVERILGKTKVNVRQSRMKRH